MKYYGQLGLLMCLAAIYSLHAQSPTLEVRLRDNYLRVAAPQLHFLEGKPLEQLHNGASVTYVFDLSLISDQRAVAHLQERFTLSFDLWEERFSVVQAGPTGRSGSHLTTATAEAWCLDHLQIPRPALSPGRSFMLKLECRAAANASESASDNSSGLTLAALIDALSRKGRDAPPRWQAFSKPLRLSELNGTVK